MIRLLPLLALLAACGVAGPPLAPSKARQDVARTAGAPNLLVSGTVEVGVGGRF